jgi:two-component system chemotaxis response regulator CheB
MAKRAPSLSCPTCFAGLTHVSGEPEVRLRCEFGHSFTGEDLARTLSAEADEAKRNLTYLAAEQALLATLMAAKKPAPRPSEPGDLSLDAAAD